MYEPEDEDEDEAAAFWREQAQLPWRKRDSLWWSEVFLSNVVVTVIAIAFAGFLVVGLVAAVGTLIG